MAEQFPFVVKFFLIFGYVIGENILPFDLLEDLFKVKIEKILWKNNTVDLEVDNLKNFSFLAQQLFLGENIVAFFQIFCHPGSS